MIDITVSDVVAEAAREYLAAEAISGEASGRFVAYIRENPGVRETAEYDALLTATVAADRARGRVACLLAALVAYNIVRVAGPAEAAGAST
jgi:hypothetical protein